MDTEFDNPALEYASRIAYSSREVLKFTYEMAKKYADKPGVYVECGVAAGAQIIAMAVGAPNKRIYAVDSFKGIPLPSNKDNQMPGIQFLTKTEQMMLPDPGKQVLESSGATVVSEMDFWLNIASAFEREHKYHESGGMIIHQVMGINVVPVVGWFEETLPSMGKWIGPISILRLDGDLYNSTYVCLKYLYPKVIKGGLVIVDDWALPGCKWAVIEYMGEVGENPNYEVINGEGSQMCYWTK